MQTLFEIAIANAVVATALAAVVWLVTRVVRHPALVQLLWVLVLAKLVTPPIVAIPWPSAGRAPQSASTETRKHAAEQLTSHAESVSLTSANFIEAELHDSAPPTSPSTTPAATVSPPSAAQPIPSPAQETPLGAPPVSLTALAIGLWLLGSVTYFLIATQRLVRFHRALRRTTPAGDDLQQLASSVASSLEFRREFNLRVTPARLTPLVWPIGRPTILLSQPLVDELTQEELKTLLAHEFAHLQRRDHWVRWLELVATALYWWHPAVWCARRAIQNAEERACDAWVVGAFPTAARHYASALFKTVDFVTSPPRPAPILASGLTSGGDLKERIQHVMNATWKTSLSLPARLAILATALAILPLSLRADADDAPQSETAAKDETPSNAQPTAEQSDPFAAPRSPRELEIERRLATPVKLEFVEVPLEEVIGQFSQTANVDIYLDPVAFDQEGIGTDAPVTIELKNEVSLKSALNLILKPFHLTFAIEDEVLKITSAQPADKPARTAAGQMRANRNINSGDIVHVWAYNTFADAPINDDFIVESAGTVALGPVYGRVKIAGLDFENAENAIAQRLAEVGVKEPKVQVTLPISATSRHLAPSLEPNLEAAQIDSTSPPRGDSIGILKIIAERAKGDYERAQAAALMQEIPQNELARAKADYEISQARIRQAQQVLKQRELELQVAELEYKQAAEANEKLPGSVTKFELEKLKLEIEFARSKLAEIAE